MSELYNFPFKNQLTDGDVNAREDCLPTSIASGMQYLLNKPFTGAQIKDEVYGKNYYGGTAAVQYIQWCASHGVRLTPKSGDPVYLDQQVHFWLGQNCPVICTEPSTYAPPANRFDPGSSHCIVFYKDGDGNLLAMNPWQAFTQSGTDAYWESVFCYGQVWVMQLPAKGQPALNIPLGWKLSSDKTTLVAPNGHYLQHGFKDFVMAHDWHPSDVPLEEEHASGNGTTVLMSQDRLTWDAKAGVQLHFIGSEIVNLLQSLKDAQAQNAQLTQEVVKLQAQPKPEPVQQPNGNLVAMLNQIESDVQLALKSFHQVTPTQSVPVPQVLPDLRTGTTTILPMPQEVPIVTPPTAAPSPLLQSLAAESASNVASGTNFVATV